MKNWQNSISAAAAFSIFACGKASVQTIFSDAKTTQIMADLAIAEAATVNLAAGYPRDSTSAAYFDQVFRRHGVSKEDFEKNLLLLSNDLERLETCSKNAEKMLHEKSGIK